MMDLPDEPLLKVRGLSRYYGTRLGCKNVSFDLWPGEVLGIVGESGSGKSTLLSLLSTGLTPSAGTVEYRCAPPCRDCSEPDFASGTKEEPDPAFVNIHELSAPLQRNLLRTDWGVVHQNPRDGLRMNVSAGANIGERRMALGERHYGKIRNEAASWLEKVEISNLRIDDAPATFSGGMQQRLQIARNLVTQPRLVFMDEPTGGLDVSVQARLLDLLRSLVLDMGLAVILVTHDLAVARLLAHRLMVMKGGEVIESGLTDQVLDDPQHPYTQLLVSSILQG